jgi:hypothetical protein
MNTLIPLEYYKAVHYYLLLLMVVYVFLQATTTKLDDIRQLKNKDLLGKFLLGWVVLYIGLRPISGKYFGDMRNYANKFFAYSQGHEILATKDIYFEYFTKLCSSLMTVEMYFLLCALLYVMPLYLASRKIFEEYWFYGFLMLVASMSFWAYGVNGMRNGIATSLFIYALAVNRRIFLVILFLAALMAHKSMAIPIAAYIVAYFFQRTDVYVVAWLLCIPLSFVLGGFWEGFFINLGLFETERLQGYFGAEDELLDKEVTGFRWDFILYSFTAVFAGYYFIIRKNFDELLYRHIFHVYLIANAFWILVIRAAFSNRFAYLSWFLMAFVIIYPLLRMEFFRKQHIIVAQIMLLYFMFTFLLGLIIK